MRYSSMGVIAVALLGMEKIAHRIYETKMRPEEFQYQPWLDRILEQIAACEAFMASPGYCRTVSAASP